MTYTAKYVKNMQRAWRKIKFKMTKMSHVLKQFLEHHQKEQTSLLCWASTLGDYCKGRIVQFDSEYLLLRDYDEETERPLELLLRLENVTAIYPSIEQQEEDEKFKKITELYGKNIE